MWEGRGRTAVVGIGFSEFARRSTTPLGRLTIEACRGAVEDAGLRPRDIDGLATYPDQPFQSAGNREGEDLVPAPYLIDQLALAPDIRWYGQVSSGLVAAAFIEGVNALLAGACNYVLVWRAMHQPKGVYGAWRNNVATGDSQFLAPFGFSGAAQVHAVAYRRYMERFGATREHMAAIVTNTRRNANLNERAYFYKEPLSFEDYMDARMIADPLCLFDCDIPVEGCVAMVLTTAERARDLPNRPAYIAGYGQQTSRQPGLLLYTLGDYMEGGRSLTGKVWERAGIGPDEVDVAQLYDGFSPSVYYWLESAGFCDEGTGFQFVQDGRIALEGELPVNTFGGSLSEGRLHGMGHIAEAVYQVTGRAGPRQVADAEVAVALDGSPYLRGAGLLLTSGP